MSFAEIEEIIGARLPPAAHAHRAWWSNNPSNNVMTRAWLGAGFVSERVDIGGERLVFRRARQIARDQRERLADSQGGVSEIAGVGAAQGLLGRLKARFAGSVTIAPGVDVAAPTGEIWDAER